MGSLVCGIIEGLLPKADAEDERCAVGIVDFDLQAGRLRHVGFRGVAQIEKLDGQQLERFLYRYIGPPASCNAKFKADIIDGLDLMIRFSPQSTVARDQSYFR